MASRPPDSPIPSEERVDAIVCENVWKVFAGRSTDLAAERAVLKKVIGEGLSRSEALERFGCVVGVGGVSFSVPHGQTFCIMGLSGSGKSTLVRHINRLIDPTAGTILIGGEDIGAKTPRQLRELRARKIGMVFQDVALWPHRSVRDNVAYGLEILGVAREERYRIAAEMLSLVQLAQWAGRYPDELSGGMRQRVGLARALAIDPEILLLDEPFSALDPLIRAQLQVEFLQIAKAVSKTTVFITHDLNEAILLGDRIAIMKEGTFVQVGAPEEIVSRPADEYVSKFVRGVSRLDIITARTIMQPIVDGCSKSPGDLDSLPTASETATLAELIDKAVTTSRAIAVCAPDGRRVGLITKDALLQAVGRSDVRAS